ncbi:MAG: RNA methyltransferase [Clostridia bacterium]|nr:RNA methyltransferase [Clostridia bacterium]
MITSSQNAQIKNIVRLNTSSKERREQGLFVVEGIKMFLEAPKELIHMIYVSESFFNKCEYRDQIMESPYEIVSDDVFKKASDTVAPQGILCLIRQKKYQIENLINQEQALLVLLEGVQDPGNLGTILRTGEGAGVTGVIMNEHTADIYNPKVIRATMGSVFRVPFCYTSQFNQIVCDLKKRGVDVLAAYLRTQKRYCDVDMKKSIAIMIGNEGKGLSDEAAELATTKINIPMQGKVESLNAAISAAIVMYEAARQRSIN